MRTSRVAGMEKCSLLGFAACRCGSRVRIPEQVCRTESELFWDERRMFFCQNRTPIVETAMNSAGGASESFGASSFFVRTRCFFLRTALKSSEHRVFLSGH